MSDWISVEKLLPPEGEFVLVHLTLTNWGDGDRGVYYKTAKLEKGISLEDREKMKDGKLPDPDEIGYVMPDGKCWEPRIAKRSNRYRGADEYGNNKRPFQWVNHGPGNYFGQDVDYWMKIPPLPQ
mgnify:CR=1 FL=1